MNNNTPHKTSIGGQALIEGIMMRGPEKASIALRLSDGTIELKDIPIKKPKKGFSINKIPFLRGIFSFVSSMRIGYKCLMYSADKMAEGMTEEEEPTKFEKWLERVLGKSATKIASALGLVLGLLFSFFIFAVLPKALFNLFNNNVLHLSEGTLNHQIMRALIEGIIRIALLLIYLVLVSKMKEMRRVLQYHGAEHKSIFCYESGKELTVENVKKFQRFHPRCGTSFLLIMFIIGMIAAFFNPVKTPFLRAIVGLLILPLIMGVSYEIIKFTGRHDNAFTRALAAPGMWMQRLTTKEPDDSMIEVAIAALNEVIPENPDSDKW